MVMMKKGFGWLSLVFFLVLISSCERKNDHVPTKRKETSTLEYSTREKGPSTLTDEDQFLYTTKMMPAQGEESADKGWFLTFEDEFESKELSISKGADPNCFSRTPTCMIEWGTPEACTEFSEGLSDLNKCHWSVYSYYNYMDQDAPQGKGINSFHPSMVEVKEGKLYLNAQKSFYTTIDCKRPFTDPRIPRENKTNLTFQCPIISGGVESRPYAGHYPGFEQIYGRFEVRARLPHGPGSWPAHWLLPSNHYVNGCGWPFTGEIDIMESWIENSETVSSHLHSGDCATKSKISTGFHWKGKKEFYPLLTDEERRKTFYEDFHTYAAEWDEDKIRFLVDDHYVGQVSAGDLKKHPNAPKGGFPLSIPQSAFYMILNTTIYNAPFPHRPNPDTFVKQEHVIDYVKVYRKCTETDPAEKCIKPLYKNLKALCPGSREFLGEHLGKNICEASPHFNISLSSCHSNEGILHTEGTLCLINEGSWYQGRRIGNLCDFPRESVGLYNNLPICKAWPHFSIQDKNCDGIKWNGFCLWERDGWWRAREIGI